MRLAYFVTALCCATSIATLACSGDHSRLEKTAGGASPGGAGGGGGAMGGSGGATGGSGGIVEPPGPPQLTIANGVADASVIRLCFVPYPGGATAELPWPDENGLQFAHAAVIAPIGDLIPADVDVEMVVIGGVIGFTAGLTCAELLAGPPTAVQVHSVGVLPASVFTAEKSILLVPNGCVGGLGHTDASEEEICGIGYANDMPTVSVAAGFMSRLIDPSKVPLQFVHASRGLGDATLRVLPSGADTAQQILSKWTPGAMAPYPPFVGMSKAQLGAVSGVRTELLATNSNETLHSALWSDAFANSALTESDVVDGIGLVFIGLGAAPGLSPGPWWSDYTYTVVLADP